ncbi:hypothetical protein [Lapidilactobacillus luobeiensis]|uniref:hypothetical protein n=1 Tax=Lapidilactobacillus luobeiensis TaxID=2950371 RepID=UPI0021C2E002|nr:hypothetical protein [Lapidilactobacillus luobeiensis]
MKYKQQQIQLEVDGQFAGLIIPEVRFQIWNRFKIRTDISTESFVDDPVRLFYIRFLGDDDVVKRVTKFIQVNFELEKRA